MSLGKFLVIALFTYHVVKSSATPMAKETRSLFSVQGTADMPEQVSVSYDDAVSLAKAYMSQVIQRADLPRNSARMMTDQAAKVDFTVKQVLYDFDRNGKNTEVHVRFRKTFGGLRMIGAGDAVVHINATDKSLLSINQKNMTPIRLTSSEISSVKNKKSKTKKVRELVIFSLANDTTLAWDTKKKGTAPDGTPLVVHSITDAKTHKQIHEFSDTKTLAPTGWPKKPLTNVNAVEKVSDLVDTDALAKKVNCSISEVATGTGMTMFSGDVSLSTSFANGVYLLKDTKRNCHYTVNYCGNPDRRVKYPYLVDDDDFISDLFGIDVCTGTFGETTNNLWGNGTSSNSNTAAAEAHFGYAAAFDFYKNVFGRQGIDNNNTQVFSRVHVGYEFSNAFWYDGMMSYGDGDGITFKSLTSLEIVAHELTHGVTESSAGLFYWGESGALNEATSDIFGVLTDFYSKDRSVYNPNYLIGDVVYIKPPYFLRSMIQPSDDTITIVFPYYDDFFGGFNYTVGSYDCYCENVAWDDVHYSSGVANHFFYLLAEGTVKGSPSRTCNIGDCNNATGAGTLIGIGKEKAGQIWYRALTVYFTEETDYLGARNATIKAATDLFTEVEVQAVQDAWTAVNVVVKVETPEGKKNKKSKKPVVAKKKKRTKKTRKNK